jgi:hypothetical protein
MIYQLRETTEDSECICMAKLICMLRLASIISISVFHVLVWEALWFACEAATRGNHVLPARAPPFLVLIRCCYWKSVVACVTPNSVPEVAG